MSERKNFGGYAHQKLHSSHPVTRAYKSRQNVFKSHRGAFFFSVLDRKHRKMIETGTYECACDITATQASRGDEFTTYA